MLEAVQHIRDPRYITVERLGPYDPRTAHIGVVMDLMIHDLDILLTMIDSEMVSFEALGASLLSNHEDLCNVRIKFKNGCLPTSPPAAPPWKPPAGCASTSRIPTSVDYVSSG